MLPPTPTKLYLVSIRFRRKISFVTSFTISKCLKKYYFLKNEIQLLELLSLLFYISFICFKFILVELGTLKKTLENALF